MGDEHQKLMEKLKGKTQFVPSITSTANLNFNFGGAGASNGPANNSPFKFSAAPAVVSQKKPERNQV